MAPNPSGRRRFEVLALILGLLLASAAVFALAASAALTTPLTVRVLMPASFADATAAPVQRFNAQHHDLRIEVVRGPLDADTLSDLAVSGLLLGDTPYDLLLIDQSWTARYASAGWLMPLESLLGEDLLADMLPGARLGTHYNGHLLRLPLQGDTGLLYWRTDLMDRPPRDLAELEHISRRLQREGRVRWGYLWQGRQYEGLSCVVSEVLQAFGAQWWQSGPGPAGGSPDLSSPEAVAAVGWLQHLIRTGITPPSVAGFAENEALQLFASGEAAFLRNWPYAYALLQAGGGPVAGHVGVTTLLGAPGQQGAGTLGSWGFSLLRHSPHPREAATVLRWLCGEEVQRHLARSYGYAPTWRSLYDDPDLQREQPLLAVQRLALEGAVSRPITPLYAQLSDVLQRQVNGLISGDGSAALAMATAQEQSETLLRAATGTTR